MLRPLKILAALLGLLAAPAARAFDGQILLPPSLIDIRSAGGISDDGGDDSPALANALDAAPIGGGVYLPPGVWQFNSPWPRAKLRRKAVIGSNPAGGSFGPQGGVTDYRGAGCVVVNNWPAPATGTDDPAFIVPGDFTTLAGFAIYDAIQGTNTNPRPYQIGTDYAPAGASSQVATDTPVVRNVAILNGDKGFRYLGVARGTIEGCFLNCFREGLRFDQSEDTIRISKVAIAPYSYLDSRPASTANNQFTQQNLIAYHLQRVDGFQATDCMVFLAKVGVLCDPSPVATTPRKTWAEFKGTCLDCCGIDVDMQASQYQGVQFTNGSMTAAVPDGFQPWPVATCIRTGPTAADNTAGVYSATFTAMSLACTTGPAVLHNGGDLVLNGLTFHSVGAMPSGSTPFIQVAGGNLSLGNGAFADARPPVSWNYNGGSWADGTYIKRAASVDPNNRRNAQ